MYEVQVIAAVPCVLRRAWLWTTAAMLPSIVCVLAGARCSCCPKMFSWNCLLSGVCAGYAGAFFNSKFVSTYRAHNRTLRKRGIQNHHTNLLPPDSRIVEKLLSDKSTLGLASNSWKKVSQEELSECETSATYDIETMTSLLHTFHCSTWCFFTLCYMTWCCTALFDSHNLIIWYA